MRAIQSGNGGGWLAHVWGVVSGNDDSGGQPIPRADHFWPMNEGTGSTLHDTIGTTNLTASNLTWASVPAIGGTCAIFNGGSASAVAAAYDPTLDFGLGGAFSISVWVANNSFSAGSLFGNLRADLGTYEGWEITVTTVPNDQYIALLVNTITTNQMQSQSTSATTTDSHLVITYNGNGNVSGLQVYFNGVNAGPTTDAVGTLTLPFPSSQPFLVGARNNNTSFFNGGMTYLRTWNEVILTPEQVSTLFNEGPK
jgi:hypothetical protein